MISTMRRTVRFLGIVVPLLGAGMAPAGVAAPASRHDMARAEFVPSNSNPTVPAGLKVTCLTSGTTLSPSRMCPVVTYRGITTWAYSFIDNRVSMALVSYDDKGRIVGNITKNGARYVWGIVYDPETHTVSFLGQSNQSVTADESELLGTSPVTANGGMGGGSRTIANVAAPGVNCVFNPTCTIVVTDSIGEFTPPGDGGIARLQSRTFEAKAETLAAGTEGFTYRLDMTGATAGGAQTNCVTRISFDFSGLVQLPYAANMTGGSRDTFSVFVVTAGGLGSVGLASETQEGNTVNLSFSEPICPGATSYFFGLASRLPSIGASQATVYFSLGGSEQIAVRVPN